jgi:hypothetical protein
MRRLGIVAVGLAVLVSLAFGAGAFALYVWPGQEQAVSVRAAPTVSPAPTLPPVPSPSPVPTHPPVPTVSLPRYTRDEAMGLVRAALQQQGYCPEAVPAELYGIPMTPRAGTKSHWSANFDRQRRTWSVAEFCYPEGQQEPPADLIPPPEQANIWELIEDTGQVIPLNESAAALMRPP